MKTCAAIILLGAVVPSLADELVFFHTEFDSLPGGWDNVNWYFSSGAHCVQQVSGGFCWEADMHSLGYPYLVPYGSDSVVVTVEHNVYLSTTDGSSEALFAVNEGYVWGKEVTSGSYQSSEDISYTMVNPGWGSGIALGFVGQADSYEYGQTTINWTVHSLTLTAFGDSLVTLDHATWASLKSAF